MDCEFSASRSHTAVSLLILDLLQLQSRLRPSLLQYDSRGLAIQHSRERVSRTINLPTLLTLS